MSTCDVRMHATFAQLGEGARQGLGIHSRLSRHQRLAVGQRHRASAVAFRREGQQELRRQVAACKSRKRQGKPYRYDNLLAL